MMIFGENLFFRFFGPAFFREEKSENIKTEENIAACSLWWICRPKFFVTTKFYDIFNKLLEKDRKYIILAFL